MSKTNDKNNKVSGNNNLLTASGDLSELNKVRDFIKSQAASFGFSEEEAYKITLAVDEACTNLIRHSFKLDKSRLFIVKIEKSKKMFTVIIMDEGSTFNPMDFPEPDMTEYLKNHKRGGLGIHIIRSVMDEVSYSPSNDKNPQNILKLKKYLH